MNRGTLAAVVRAVALAVAAASASMASHALPLARAVTAGDPLERGTAYVVLVPHLTILSRRPAEVDGMLVGKSTSGQSLAFAVAVAQDRPTIVGVEPGRYYLARVFDGDGYWTLEENDSQFDAKVGQLNYPGDWVIHVERHDIVRGARTIGYRIAGTLTIVGADFDLSTLGLDPAFSALPMRQTRVEPAGHATGFGER